MARQMYKFIPYRDTDEQKILEIQLDHMNITGQSQAKAIVSSATCPWWLTPYKNLRYQMILFKETVDQRILQSNLTRSLTDHAQPKVVVSDATFPVMTNCMDKKLRYQLILSQDIENQRIKHSDCMKGKVKKHCFGGNFRHFLRNKYFSKNKNKLFLSVLWPLRFFSFM